ncbi:hypothetical protein MNY32_03675 [Ralstonia pseudosolanacearum]|nr:hypothetical protein MNY32_03675 [Ralstonia pseudosolanacearum]
MMTAAVAASVVLAGVVGARLVQHVPEQLARFELLQDLVEQLYCALELAGIDTGTRIVIPRRGRLEMVVRAINLDGHDCLGKKGWGSPRPSREARWTVVPFRPLQPRSETATECRFTKPPRA